MPLLISILSVSAGGQFIDDSDGLFISDAEGVFEDSEGILRLSTENFTGNRYWSGDVVNIDPIAWRMDNIYGGACRLSGAGNIQITLKALDSADWWFQDMKYPCRIEYTDALEDSAILLIDCTLHLKNIDLPLSATFDVFPESYDSKLLETAVNYDGETVVLPKAFGTVNYVKPIRLADTLVPTETWVQNADFGGLGVDAAVAAAVGTKIYVGTGNESGTRRSDWWAYDTVYNIWTQKKNFDGSARQLAVAAAVGNSVYIGTGNASGGDIKDWWAYDTTADTWTQKTDFGGAARSYACTAAVGTKIYVGLGIGGATEYKDWWAYDTAANSWAAKTDFGGTSRYGSVAAAVGTKIYVGLGLDGAVFKKDWWMYDTVANTWTAKTDFGGVARNVAVAVAIGTKIYVGTGFDGSIALKDWWAYDTTTDTWTQSANLAGNRRYYAVGAVVGNNFYIGTGTYEGTFYDMRDWWSQNSTSMKQQYSAGGLLTCSVYDDGVDVTSNASAISGNVFTYNVQPVGELTISGTSPYIYTHTIFPYLCGASFLNLGCNMAFAGTSQIDRWVTEQINVIDFLSNIAAAETIYFWVQSGVLNVRSFTAGYSPAVVVDVADDALEGTDYFYSQPVSIFRSKWKQRVAVEESIGKYVKETDQEETAATVYPYGSEIEIDTFTETRTTATARLVAIMARYNLTQTSLTMPLQNITTKPGDALTLSDDRFTGREIVAKAGIIRDVVFDIINKKWTIEADGNFFS